MVSGVTRARQRIHRRRTACRGLNRIHRSHAWKNVTYFNDEEYKALQAERKAKMVKATNNDEKQQECPTARRDPSQGACSVSSVNRTVG